MNDTQPVNLMIVSIVLAGRGITPSITRLNQSIIIITGVTSSSELVITAWPCLEWSG